MLHLACKLAPTHRLNCVSGAALQMQREIQWFKVHHYSGQITNVIHLHPNIYVTEIHGMKILSPVFVGSKEGSEHGVC